jgi:hypothetical protein
MCQLYRGLSQASESRYKPEHKELLLLQLLCRSIFHAFRLSRAVKFQWIEDFVGDRCSIHFSNGIFSGHRKPALSPRLTKDLTGPDVT